MAHVAIFGLLLACIVSMPAAAGENQDPKETAARRAVQQQLRHRQPAVRAEAFRKLKDFPPLEAARLLVQSGLADRQPEVRRAAYETLKGLAGDDEVAAFLLKALEKQIRGQADAHVAAPLIGAILGSESEKIRTGLCNLLDQWADAKASGAALIYLADELGAEADKQALESLHPLARLKRFTESFAFRRAVVQAMIRLHRREAVGALIELLPATSGEVRGDIVRYLVQVTGQAQFEKPEAWRAWWKEHGDDFALRKEAGPQLAMKGGPSYYGLAIHARRLVFVIDISGSMQGARIAAAKRELASAINALPEECEFSVIAYNQVVGVWQSTLVPANPGNKQGAIRFVAYLNAGGLTAAYDALDAAFRFDAEAVYFLTDGEPTAGKIVAPREIVAAVSQGNRTRRISIYAIGIAPGPPGGPLDTFLRTLAEQNYGLYRRVEQ